MDEFRLIGQFFERPSIDQDVVVPVGDDGAVIDFAGGRQVQVLDTLVEGVHFPADLPAADIGWRAVAVNLSDLAAMGATPRWITLGLTLATSDEAWLAEFSSGLFAAAEAFDVALIGGDTTRGKQTVVTIAATGVLPSTATAALLRSGAQIGDRIFVTGTLGDAAAGLAQFGSENSNDFLAARFARPTPRINEGSALLGVATAAIDVSDGLVADLDKLLQASGVGGELKIEQVPLSDALRQAHDVEQGREFALTGGDDYELCFTAADGMEFPFATAIGSVTDSGALLCTLNGKIVTRDSSGYRHFHD